MTFWLALSGSLSLTGVLVLVLRRLRLLDMPNERSSHQLPTPRGGGGAVMLALVLGLAFAEGDVEWSLVAAALVLACVGLIDDLRSLPARARLATQLGVAAIVTAMVADQGNLQLLALVAIGVVGIVAYVNAFNFMDGVNGISAMHATLTGGWFVWLGEQYDVSFLVGTGAALAGASLGFLPWNATGRIFLGDVGSYGLGALIAVTTLAAWSNGVPLPVVLAPLTVYFADTGWVLVRRARAGEPLMQPHRDHVYQRLVRQGWPHLVSAAWSALVAGIVCLLVIRFAEASAWLFPMLIAPVLVYLASPRLFGGLVPRGKAPA